MCGYYVWQMPLGVSKLKASRREVRHYTPRSDPRDWLDILRRKRFRVFHEKNVRRKLFSRVDTISTSANTKRTNTTYIIMINSTGWWMLVITEGDPRIFFLLTYFFFDDIIFVFLLFLYCRSHSSSSSRCSCSLSAHRNVSNRPGTTRRILDRNLYKENTIYYIYIVCIIAVVIYICEFWSRSESGGDFSSFEHNKNMTNRLILRSSSADFKCSQPINYWEGKKSRFVLWSLRGVVIGPKKNTLTLAITLFHFLHNLFIH